MLHCRFKQNYINHMAFTTTEQKNQWNIYIVILNDSRRATKEGSRNKTNANNKSEKKGQMNPTAKIRHNFLWFFSFSFFLTLRFPLSQHLRWCRRNKEKITWASTIETALNIHWLCATVCEMEMMWRTRDVHSESRSEQTRNKVLVWENWRW